MLAAIPTKAVVISQGIGTRVASTYYILLVFHSTLASKLSFLRLHKREEERGQEGFKRKRRVMDALVMRDSLVLHKNKKTAEKVGYVCVRSHLG